MSTEFKPHPVMPLPTAVQAAEWGAVVWGQAMAKREKILRDERLNPLWKSWEPPIWKVCDALWGAPWLDAAEAEAIRLNLKFRQPVTVLYLLGAQRSSKTEYAANRMSRIAQRQADGLSWVFHNTMPASIDAHQKLFWKFLPANLRGKAITSQTTYVAYKDKTGFSDGSFVLPNLHKTRFLSYDMELTDLQGLNLDAAWGDEFVTPEHVDTFKARVSVKNGPVFITLAPIEGYTPLVKSASDGAEMIRDSLAFMSPSDGGPRHLPGYLGLTAQETEELRGWLGRKQKPPYPSSPWSRPEDCTKWLTGEPSQPPAPEGRVFKKVARVVKPQDAEERSAIVHFHGGDNPFGNPLSLALLNTNSSEERGNQIFYGVARDVTGRKFPKFSKRVHVIPEKAIPVYGTNYLWVDPAEGRNFFMTWIRVTPKASYVYREWPGSYEIPEQGVPGPWALPSGKLGDGAVGPGQDGFGYGLADYKREIARLEGWKDCGSQRPEQLTDTEWIKTWFPEHGTREAVLRRFIDSRFASAPHMQNDRPVTLLEDLAEMGLFFETTPGADIAEGVTLINSLLAYDTTKPIDAFNCPHLFISEECRNTIFALETWRGKERGKGATKDPIDNLRYFTLQGVIHVDAQDFETEGGGSY